MTHISICHSFLEFPERGYNGVGVCIVFSLERRLKRENRVCKKPMDVCNWCKYSRDSYLNLSLISGLPRKGIFSLLNEYRREGQGGRKRQKGYECASRTMSGCKSV